MNLLSEIRRRSSARSLADGAKVGASFNGQLLDFQQSYSMSTHEGIGNSFISYVEEGYKANGALFAVELARLLLFCEATFKFRKYGAKPDDLYGTPALAILERPWTKARTSDLLARMEQDSTFAGNSYTWRADRKTLRRLRPDWVSIVVGVDGDAEAGPADINAEILAYLFTPGGYAPGKGDQTRILMPDEVAHYAPIPDPTAFARGMSWLTPVVREVDADSKMTDHKGKFFDHAATPNLIIKTNKVLERPVRKRLEKMLEQRYTGPANAWRTMLIEGGADVEAIGHSFEQIGFNALQAAGENRIAAAGGVPGIVAGLKEGLQAATYSNFEQAMRRFADLTMRPLWRAAANALEDVVDTPAASQLWFATKDIPALAQGEKDQAEINKANAQTMRELIYAGYEPDSVTAAVNASDMSLLKHSGAIPTVLYPDGVDPKTPASS